MAFSKAREFPPEPLSQSYWSKATAHPARILILLALLQNGPTHFDQLAKMIPLDSTTVSQHLRYLREANLIIPESDYPRTYYSLNESMCARFAQDMLNLVSLFIPKKK